MHDNYVVLVGCVGVPESFPLVRRYEIRRCRGPGSRCWGPQDFFKYLDVLVYVEATIYAMDEENERLAGAGVVSPVLELNGMPPQCPCVLLTSLCFDYMYVYRPLLSAVFNHQMLRIRNCRNDHLKNCPVLPRQGCLSTTVSNVSRCW
jgi:hypothetical protein